MIVPGQTNTGWGGMKERAPPLSVHETRKNRFKNGTGIGKAKVLFFFWAFGNR